MEVVEDKAKRVVFVVGGSSRCLRPQVDLWKSKGKGYAGWELMTGDGVRVYV